MTGLNKSAAWLLPGGLALLVGLVAAEAQPGPRRVEPVAIRWAPLSNGGGESAQLPGPQDQKGVFYTSRIHLMPGGLVAPHTHPDERYTTVLSGTLYVCSAETVSPDTPRPFPAGSFFVMPAAGGGRSWGKGWVGGFRELGEPPAPGRS